MVEIAGINIQGLINQCPDNGTIYLPEGSFEIKETLNINKPIHIVGKGKGTYLFGTFDGPIFSISNVSGIEIEHIRFDAQKPLGVCLEIVHDEVIDVFRDDFLIHHCHFQGKGTGIDVYKSREGTIDHCTFTLEGESITLNTCTNVQISNCKMNSWSAQNAAIVVDGNSDNPHACGVRIINNTIIGYLCGINIAGNDYGDISNNMIDYCDYPIIVEAQDQLLIAHNYIGSRGNQADGKSIAIKIDSKTQDYNQHIRILGNNIITYDGDIKDRSPIIAHKVNGLMVCNNTMSMFTNAWHYSDCFYIITDNNISMGV